jgi:hypothetical protein
MVSVIVFSPSALPAGAEQPDNTNAATAAIPQSFTPKD